MDFKEFKEKYFGRDLEYIKDGLKNEQDFFKKSEEVEMIKLCIDAQVLADSLVLVENNMASLFLFKKMYKMLIYMLQNLTNLELIPEDESFEDYDYFVMQSIIQLNSKAAFFNIILNEILQVKNFATLNELTLTFNKGLPTKEDITQIKNELENMFDETSPDKLKTIENILAYNDPNLKHIKEYIYTPNVVHSELRTEDKKEEHINNKKHKILEETQQNIENITSLINNNIAVQEVNDNIIEEQKKRIEQYNKELNQMLNNNS